MKAPRRHRAAFWHVIAVMVALAVVSGEVVGLLVLRREVDRAHAVSSVELGSAMQTFRPADRRGLARSVSAAELDPSLTVRVIPVRCSGLTVLTRHVALDGESWTGVNGSPPQPVTTLTIRYADAAAARAELRDKQLALLRCRTLQLTFPPFDGPAQEFKVVARAQLSNLVVDRASYALVGHGRRFDFYIRAYANTLTWTYADDVSSPVVRQQVVDSLVLRLRNLTRR